VSFPSNKPSLDRLIRRLQVAAQAADVAGLGIDLSAVDPDVLVEMLEASTFYVEDQANTLFDGRQFVEKYDGNGTNGLALRRWPIGQVREVKVELPVLALSRVYTASEVKTYRFQGRITIFTYKLAAEQASLHLDQQLYGNIFPTLPQCVTVTYTAGFPRYDVDADLTTWDNGVTSEPGDTRDPLDERHVRLLAEAATCDATASFLAQASRLGIGTVQSVSFDGYSRSMNPQAHGPTIEALVNRRDELLGRRRRGFILSSTTGY
jgi:hypothetical protein